MKKTLSLILSVMMVLTVFSTVAFADNGYTLVNTVSAEDIKNYVNTNFSTYTFDENNYFVADYSDCDYFGENPTSVQTTLEISTDSSDEVKGLILQCVNGTIYKYSTLATAGGSEVAITAKTSKSVGLGVFSDVKTKQYIFVLDATEELKNDVNITFKVSRNDDAEQYVTDTYTFKAPITFSFDSLDKFADLLNDKNNGKEMTADAIADALDAVTADTTNYDAAVEELADALDNSLIKELFEVYNKGNVSVESADGVDLPWAALATGTNGADTVFKPVVSEGSLDSITVGDEIQYPADKNDSFALDIKLYANDEEVATPVVKQKVVVTMPSNWDLSDGVQYKHDNNEWDSATVEGNKAIIYTDSFSNFIFAGTKATANESVITDLVRVVVVQNENNDSEFDIFIESFDKAKQIVNYAVGGYSIDIRSDEITDDKKMTTVAYELIENEADGVVITNREDVDKGDNYLASVKFNTQVGDNDLITVPVGGKLKIATLKLTGKGKFRMVVGGREYGTVGSTENNIMMKTTAAGYDDDAYAEIGESDADYEIVEKTHKLNFNIDFKYGITKTEADYLGMKINIKNTTTKEVKTILVGSQGTEIADEYLDVVTTGTALDNESVATGYIELPEKTNYEYEIVAGGFRKFSGSVYLDEDKTINLWNTVWGSDKAVVTGDDRDANMRTITFLVGDIWMDNKVDVYDLSAVTAYFGTQNIEAGSNFVQYDLDRDGDVDLRDIGYAQLTFGN